MIEILRDENYSKKIENNEKIFFVDFYSPTCGPCQELGKFLHLLDENFKNTNIQIFKCDISTNPKIVEKYNIRSVPLTLIIDKDKKIKEAKLGIQSSDYYFNLFNKYINMNETKKVNKKSWWKFW